MKKILKLMVLILLFQFVLVSCEDDEKDVPVSGEEKDSLLRYDYFRDIAGFSNSLYRTYVYDRSPYHSVKKETIKAIGDGSWYKTQVVNYDDGYYAGGSIMYNDGTIGVWNREWTDNSFKTYEDEILNNTGTVNDKGLMTSYLSGISDYSATYKYDGWDLLESNSESTYDDYKSTNTAKYTFDGKLPKSKVNISINDYDDSEYPDYYYETKTEYTNDGDKVISSTEYSKSSSDDELELSSETTYEYDDGNVVKVVTKDLYDGSYDVVLLTWKDNLPVEQKYYWNCESEDDCTDENLDYVKKYEWSKKRLVRETHTSYNEGVSSDPTGCETTYE